MALPNKINNATPLADDDVSLGDDEIRAFKLAVQDIVGIPQPSFGSTVAAAGFTFVAAGLQRVVFGLSSGGGVKNQLTDYLVPKVWAKLSTSGGVPAIDADFGIDTVTDNGVGDFTLTVLAANVFSTANWCPVATTQGSTSSGATEQGIAAINALATNTVRLVTKDVAGTLTDPTVLTMVGFGIQV